MKPGGTPNPARVSRARLAPLPPVVCRVASGDVKAMIAKLNILLRLLNQIAFLVIVRYECDLLIRVHANYFIVHSCELLISRAGSWQNPSPGQPSGLNL